MTPDHEDPDEVRPQGEASSDNFADEFGEQLVSRFYSEKRSPTDEWVAQVGPPRIVKARSASTGGEPTDISRILKGMFESQTVHKARPHFTPELVARRDEIRALAEQLLGSVPAAKRWLSTTFQHALGGSSPIDLMTTWEGCEKVESFLRSLYPEDD